MAIPNFSNTQIAYESKSDADLKRAYWLFKSMNSPSMVKYGSALASAALRIGLPVKGLIRATIYKQFCGGESIEKCEEAINTLGKFHIGTILDYSVEGKESEAEFDACAQEIIRTVHKARNDQRIPFSVFKVTGVARFTLLEKVSHGAKLSEAENAEWTRVFNRIDKICAAAAEADQMIFIDAEESWIQDAIDVLADNMMAAYNKQKPLVFNTIQLYRHDRLAFLKESYQRAQKENYFLGVKLVRGAYMEKERKRASEMGYPSPIQPDKSATDHDYDAAVAFCIENIDRIALCAGTHNEDSTRKLAEAMETKGIEAKHPHIWFSQLLGMSDNLSYNLSHTGFNIAKYVPYGPVESVMPYLVRRAQENTSISGQMSRELSLLVNEIERRKGR